MLSDSLVGGLEEYGIGPKIRTLRLRKGLGLVQLGEHTGLSPGLLSKIERSQLFPTLPTLLKISMVFGVGLEHFFDRSKDRMNVVVIRKKDRFRLPDRPGDGPKSYFFESLDFPVRERKLEAYYAEFEPISQVTEPHEHRGAEIIYVINGRLAVNVEGEETVLVEGDVMYFDSGFSHTYCRRGRGVCSAIVVVSR